MLPELRELGIDVSNNGIEDSGFSNFEEVMEGVQQIQVFEFNVYHVKMNEQGVVCMGQGLARLKNLKRLKLSFMNDRYTGEELLFLGKCIAGLENLEDLSVYICYNQMKGAYFKKFLEGFLAFENENKAGFYGKLKKLRFDLKYNLIG